MGRALKLVEETKLYFYNEDNSIIIDCSILINKIIIKFLDQYYQLIKYSYSIIAVIENLRFYLNPELM